MNNIVQPNHTRLDGLQLGRVQKYTLVTAAALQKAGLIKENSFGVTIVDLLQGSTNPVRDDATQFGYSKPSAKRDAEWYCENTTGKAKISEETGMDSHEAIRMYPGRFTNLEGAFPWGGAIISLEYGLIVAVSGFEEDEDIAMAKAIMAYIIMLLDREGEAVLLGARTRGEEEGEAGADRFTRSLPVMVH